MIVQNYYYFVLKERNEISFATPWWSGHLNEDVSIQKIIFISYRDDSLYQLYIQIISIIIHVWFWNNANAFSRLPYTAKI
jgi:hypothetical protein